MLHYLRRNYLNCIVLDVQASSLDTVQERHTMLGAILKRDFFKHRAFRWFATGKRQNSATSMVSTKTAKVTHDVVFLTSGVAERVKQLPYPPVLFVYDETGERDNVACRLVRTLKVADQDVVACYLQGGISMFARRFPYFTDPRPQGSQLHSSGASTPADTTEICGPRLRKYQAAILSGNDVEPSLILRRNGAEIATAKLRLPLGSTSASPPSFATNSAGVSPYGNGVNSMELATLVESLTLRPGTAPTAGSVNTSADLVAEHDVSNAPFLFLSGMKGAAEEYIVRHQITHVLNVTHHQHMTAFNHVEYLRVAIDDNPKANIQEFFEAATAFIERARARPDGRVLVHCYAGVSRSVSMVLAYLIRFHHCTLLQAFDVVYRNRPVAQPNEGFVRKLQKYEMAHRKTPHPSVAHGWLSASNMAFLAFIEFVEGYDELYRRALSRRHATGSASLDVSISIPTSPTVSIQALNQAVSPAGSPTKSNRRLSTTEAGGNTIGIAQEAAASLSSTIARQPRGIADAEAAAIQPEPRQSRTRLILSGLYNRSGPQQGRGHRGLTM